MLSVLAADWGGVGVVIVDRRSVDEGLRTGVVYSNTPAGKAGIRSNMYLIAIDGTNVQSMTLTQVIHMVRGPVGTRVTLELSDDERTRTNRYELKRGRVVFREDQIEIVEE
jgi:C-terminal processing protease CtpA/Prc